MHGCRNTVVPFRPRAIRRWVHVDPVRLTSCAASTAPYQPLVSANVPGHELSPRSLGLQGWGIGSRFGRVAQV